MLFNKKKRASNKVDGKYVPPDNIQGAASVQSASATPLDDNNFDQKNASIVKEGVSGQSQEVSPATENEIIDLKEETVMAQEKASATSLQQEDAVIKAEQDVQGIAEKEDTAAQQEDGSVFCRMCGAKLEADSAFCTKCGASVE